MEAALLADMSDAAQQVWEFVWHPIRDTPWKFWADEVTINGATIKQPWRNWWLRLVVDDRYLVSYFLLLVPILLLFTRRHLRVGIILTGLVFLAYVFGLLYPLFWLAMCVTFYKLAEVFAVESKRKDILLIGPPLAAVFCVVGFYLAIQAIQHVKIPDVTDWLFYNVPWAFPLGSRGLLDRPFAWEPFFAETYASRAYDQPAPLFHAIFYNVHNIGTAYFTIRMLHYFSEIRRDGIAKQRRSLLNFLAYLCYAPNLMQGPIERFNEFQSEMDTCHERRAWRNVPPALARIGWGFLKCFLGIWYFMPRLWVPEAGRSFFDYLYYPQPERVESYALLYFGVYLQIYWLYLEFSGYCDISAGIARLLGYRQVENFRWCWFATSLRDFWRRWHISLSFILRDYVYIALGGNRKRTILNLMITFGLIGVWHAPNFRFLAWGVVMGLMLAINQWWARKMKRLAETPDGWLPALRRGWLKLKPLPQICSWALTMHCFVMSLLIFFGGSGALRVGWELFRRPLNWLLQDHGVVIPPLNQPPS